MRPVSIRFRLTLWFVSVLVVILAGYSAWVGGLLWDNLVDALEHHLEEDFHFAVQMVVPDGPGIAWRGVTDNDPGYEGGVRRWVEVWSLDGRLLFSRSSPEVEPLQRLLTAPKPGPDSRIVNTPLGRLRVMAQAVDLQGLPVVVRVARTEAAEWEEMRPVVMALTLGIPLFVALAGAGGYILARRALAPVAQMAERAQHISAEQLDARLPVANPRDELGQLATVFNETFARLERSFDSLRRFTADASHELRTPLTAIRSVGEVGLSHPRSVAEYQDIIGSMLEETNRLAQLVDGLLLLSRADAGSTVLRRESIDLRAEVRDVVGRLAVLAEEKGQAVEIEAPEAVVLALDRGIIRHALVNLLDNAIKYGPAGSTVRLHVRREADAAVVDVSDEGAGVPREDWERVFERFYRVDRARSRDEGGCGLGLSIARWAAEIHGGQLAVVPGDGAGANFRLTLPAG